MTAPVIIPTIHLNGSSGEELRRENREARRAIRAAIAAVAEAAPNARDYYPQGDTAYPAARRAHDARLSALHVIDDELHEIGIGIEDAIAARVRR